MNLAADSPSKLGEPAIANHADTHEEALAPHAARLSARIYCSTLCDEYCLFIADLYCGASSLRSLTERRSERCLWRVCSAVQTTASAAEH